MHYSELGVVNNFWSHDNGNGDCLVLIPHLKQGHWKQLKTMGANIYFIRLNSNLEGANCKRWPVSKWFHEKTVGATVGALATTVLMLTTTL